MPDTEQVVLISAVGGALFLIITIFIVIAATVCIYKQKGCIKIIIVYCSLSLTTGKYGSRSPRTTPMVTNPIYEGQSAYETIDPHFRPLNLASSPLPPLDSNSHTPIQSPYSLGQIDPNYASPHFHPVEEVYTIMASAAAAGCQKEASGESNINQQPPDVVRYVPDPSVLVTEC